MKIKNREKLKKMLNDSNMSNEQLSSFSYRLCLDLEMLITTTDDVELREYAKEKLMKIRQCFDDFEIVESDYVDQHLHLDNYCCREAEKLLSNIYSLSYNRGEQTIQNIDALLCQTNSVYGKEILLKAKLKSDSEWNMSEAIKIMELCGEIYAVEPDNNYIKELYFGLKQIILSNLKNEEMNLEFRMDENNTDIARILGNIEKLRR